MKIISQRAIEARHIQEEYQKLLNNEDIVFLQVCVFVFKEGGVKYVHLKGGRYGRRPNDVEQFLISKFGIHGFRTVWFGYFYSDHNMRAVYIIH